MSKKSISLTLALMLFCYGVATPGMSDSLRPRAVIERGENNTQARQSEPKWGNATVAFRLMNSGILGGEAKEDINVMLTYKCPFNCAHCLAVHAREEGKNRDTPKEALFSIFDELRGFKKVHIVGAGEPLSYGKENPLSAGASQDFIDVVRYAAERIEEVRIVTNAYLVPEDLEEAGKFFAQFPPNVVWLVSVDKFHAEQMEKRVNKSLKRIVDTMEQLASQNIIRTAYNVRIETNEASMPILESFGLSRKMLADRANVFINRVQSIGSAVLHNLQGIPLRDDDIRRHGDDPAKLFLFIDPDGYVLTSDHIAYMTVDRKQYLEQGQLGDLFILGNVNRRPLANIILEQLFFFNMSRQTTVYFNAICERLRPYYNALLPVGSLATVDIRGSWEGIWQNVIKAVYFYSIGDIGRARRLMADFDNSPQPIKYAIADILYYLFIYNKCPELTDIEDFVRQCVSPDWMIQADIGLSFSSAFRILNSQRPNYQILDTGIRLFEGRPWDGMPKRWISDGSGFSFCPVYKIRTMGHLGMGLLWSYAKRPFTESSFIGSIKGSYRLQDEGLKQDEISLWQVADDIDGSAQEYFRRMEFANAGLIPYPIGLLHDLETDKCFYMEQSIFVDETIPAGNMDIQFSHVFSYRVMSPEERIEQLKTLAEKLGAFAAKLDKAGINLNYHKFTLTSVRERMNGTLILAGSRTLNYESDRAARDIVLGVIKGRVRQKGREDLYRDKADIMLKTTEESFNKGYYGEITGTTVPAPMRNALASSILRPLAVDEGRPQAAKISLQFYDRCDIFITEEKMKKSYQLPIFIEKDEDGFYVVECPIFAGCYTQGKTLDAALKNIREVIALCLEEKENKEVLKNFHPQELSFHTLTYA